ncbi:MAG: ATP-binding protein [Nitrospirota bacterium]
MAEHNESPRRNHSYLLILLIAATIIVAASTVLNYRSAVTAAGDSLRLQALGIAVSLEASLKDHSGLPVVDGKLPASGNRNNLFKDIIAEGKWEGIAFIALYDREGMTLLHSNENLIGRRVADPTIRSVATSGSPAHGYFTLGTDERVFILDFPVHLQDSVGILRLSLHTYPVERSVRQARFQLASIAFVISILWGMGFFFIRAVKRSEELKKAMAERERLAVLGGMASVLAHEIRNPLGSIKGFAQYLREGKRQEQDNKEYLDIIVSESERLEALTEDLLLYAKPVEIKAEAFDINNLIGEVVRMVQGCSEGKPGLTVQQSAAPALLMKSDKDKLRQVLLNIMQNAADAVEGSGMVAISTQGAGDRIIITIKDNGYGMDKETKEKAFVPFYTTKTRGTGLGLAIVDKLVKALDGTIEVESEYGKGTEFRITLPKNLI